MSVSSLDLNSLSDNDKFSDVSSATSSFDDCGCTPLCSSKPEEPPTPEIPHYSVVIIGAGPHALGLASRLSEEHPGSLYTDLEHARLSWLRKPGEKDRRVKGHWNARKLQEARKGVDSSSLGIKVFDASGGEWMSKWNSAFEGLGITHLRSPMFFHPAPADVDELVAYAQGQKRYAELFPIANVVGKERSKHARKNQITRKGALNERSRQDYFRPSTRLFEDFCKESIIDRYKLSSIIEQGTVVSVTYDSIDSEVEGANRVFEVTTLHSNGETSVCRASAVVFAMGPSGTPNVPQPIEKVKKRKKASKEAWCHSGAFAKKGFVFPPLEITERARRGCRTKIVVFGGGLTSAQICDLAVSRGVSDVSLVCRSKLKCRHFDFPLEWVSKYANLNKMAFWQEEDPSLRFETFREARNGGSVNPTHYHLLKKLEKQGRLTIITEDELTNADWESKEGWKLELKSGTKIEGVDHVVCATGVKLAFDQVECVKPLLRQYPIEIVHGLPVITKDLQWSQAVPAFVMGAYAGLDLGPDAPNLAGSRTGAERIAHRLGQLQRAGQLEEGDCLCDLESNQIAEDRVGGIRNWFDGLQVE